MILYKNVDIKDLDSILERGILSLNECGNDNWDEGKRSDNSRDVVYLFTPLGAENSFCNYGAALLEVNLEDEFVKQNELGERDVNSGKYIEYITDKVSPDKIKKIYIPEIFKSRVEQYDGISENTLSKITWCDIKANHYGENDKEPCPDDVMKRFAKTAAIIESTFNFFRGENPDRTMIDLYDVQYILG